MKRPLRIAARLVLSASAQAQGTPRRFAIQAYDGGPLPIDGFELPVIADLSDIQFVDSMPLLIDHERNVSSTLGTIEEVINTGRSLQVSGIVTGTSPLAQQVIAQADMGHKWQASISADIGDLEKVPVGQVVEVNGQTFEGPVLVARQCEMFEVSVLPLGADMTTKVNLAAAAASLKGAAAMSFEDWLASLGIDPAALTEDGRNLLMMQYEASQSPSDTTAAETPVEGEMTDEEDPNQMAGELPGEETTDEERSIIVIPAGKGKNARQAGRKMAASATSKVLSEMRASLAGDVRRVSQIRAMCSNYPNIAATAIENGWSLEKTEIAVLKAQAQQRQRVPDNRVRSKETAPRILEAALCQSRKIPGHEKQFTDQELQAAHTAFRGTIGLQQVIMQASVAGGYSFSPGEKINLGNIRDVLTCAFPRERQIRAAGPTILSLPGIFSNIANKELLAGYEMNKSYMLWKEIAEIKSVSDFKTVTSYRLLDNAEYEELPAGGRMKHGTLSEDSYTRSAKTYAKMFVLTLQDIVNDDLSAFDDLRKRLGGGAAKKLSNVFWAKFLDNVSFFTAGRGNYISGSTTTLSDSDATGLKTGISAFRNMKSSAADGEKRIGGEPEVLMVPPELAYIAEAYYVNQNLGGGTTVANANIFANKYRPLIVPWLSDATFAGYSATAWYLLRNPTEYATMVVSFLDGVESPTVESADADFDQLGIQFRGYQHFGCDQAEFVGGLKSKGAA